MVKGSLSDLILKERKTPCDRCQKTSCTCVHTGVTPLSPHLVLPIKVDMQNYSYMTPSQIHLLDRNYVVPNSIFAINPNLIHYQNLQTPQPSPVPVLSPGSSISLSSSSSSSSSPSPPTTRTSPVKTFTTTKRFKCNECYKSFDYKHVLQNHERIHTGFKPYECVVCKKKFTRDHHLKTHIRLHTGEKPYICQYCNMRFVQVANLRRHLKVHEPIQCSTCNQMFPDSSLLRKHLLEHAKDSKLCNICHQHYHDESKCPLKLNSFQIGRKNDDINGSSSGDSRMSIEPEQSTQYETNSMPQGIDLRVIVANGTQSEPQSTQYETNSMPQGIDLRVIVANGTQSEPEDLSMKKYT